MNYNKIKEVKINEINSTICEYKHTKTNTTILYVKNSDDNKVCLLSFYTPPIDNTGVTHIIEHSVLNGSKHYPIKNPFNELIKGSLHTYLNALTYIDRTVYPVASRNNKDFKNLMDVYLDAVFNPLIFDDKTIFQQEGWHYDKESDSITGVVYNEMKGAEDIPGDRLVRLIMENLYRDTYYKHISGGDPKYIPDLTYEQFINYYKTYYHPSNCTIVLYGDMDIDEQLDYLDKQYLSKYEYKEINKNINIQPYIEETIKDIKTYPVGMNDEIDKKTYLSLSFLLNIQNKMDKILPNVEDKVVKEATIIFGLDILKRYMTENEGGLLKEAISEHGDNSIVNMSFELNINQPYMTVVLEGSEEENMNKFVDTVYSTFKEFYNGKFDKSKLLSEINNYEFCVKEQDYMYMPKGIVNGLNLIKNNLYDKDLHFLIQYEKELDIIKSEVNNGFFEKIVKELFLDNKHILQLVLKPEVKEENTNSVDDKYKYNVMEESSFEYQTDTSIIPILQLSDINKENDPFPIELEEHDNYKILYSEADSNGIIYLSMLFDFLKIPQELHHVAAILMLMYGRVNTKKHSYSELDDLINNNMGAFSANISSNAHISDHDFLAPVFEISAKTLNSTKANCLNIIHEILTESVFIDKKHVKEIIEQDRTRILLDMDLFGPDIASVQVESHYHKSSRFVRNAIYPYLRYITELLDHFDERYDQLVQDLEIVKNLIINTNDLVIGITTTKEVYKEFKPAFMSFLNTLPNTKIPRNNYVYDEKLFTREGILSQTDVQYISKGSDLTKFGYKFNGSLKVLQNIIEFEYLWPEIREKGGAYGAMASFSTTGYVEFSTYRDPFLKESLDIIDNTDKFLLSRVPSLTEKDIQKYIIGVISTLDLPRTPLITSGEALKYYITGTTKEIRQQIRTEILNTTLKDIKGSIDLVHDILKDNSYCVYGNEHVILDQSDLFENIVKKY